ncbi:MAG: MucR family transcriptional regulator [Alphaproteobacteria bacterium]
MPHERTAPTSAAPDLLSLATDIVAAYVSNNAVPTATLADLIRAVHRALADLRADGGEAATAQTPAVPVKRSVTPDHLICLEDGKKLKMLKRHLRSAYGLTPEQYRRKWDLPSDYPMVAPNYAAQRAAFAKSIGLGRGARGKAAKKRGK